MTYLKLCTIESESSLTFYIEVTDNNMEHRRVEIANGGLLGFASSEISYRETILDSQPLLTLEELKELANFEVQIIAKEEFETIWNAALIAVSE